jgi:uncharacterized protein YbjT (DUF2867 family)
MINHAADVADPVLVLGATGGQGGAVLRALLRAGRPVRALVRNENAAAAVRLARSGVELRDNALGGEADIRAGVLALPLPPDRPLQQLDRDDLGRFVAEVLAAPARHAGARIELAGDAPTPAAMAAALTDALARPVRHEEVPLTAIDNPDMRAMWRFLGAEGYRADIPALHRDHPGIGWTSFAAWADRTFA